MAVVIREVRFTVFAAGLVGGDELVMDVEGCHWFVARKPILLTPNHIEHSQVILFLWR